MQASTFRFDVYQSFAYNSFLKMLAYRMRYVTGILTYVIFVSVHYFIWQAVFSSSVAGQEINGFSLNEMVSYIVIAWISRSLYFSNIDYEINQLVVTGDIRNALLRPVSFQLMMLSSAMGECLFRALFFALPVATTLLLIYDIQAPVSFNNFILFILATVLSFLIMVQLNFVVGLLSFSIKSIRGIIQAKYYIVQLCSGLLLPLTFFPDSIERVLEMLPFQLIAYFPLQLYLGKIDSAQILQGFILGFIWFLVLSITGKVFWNRAINKLTHQGG